MKIKPISQNKKGQLDNPIIAFAILVLALIMFAPIALKIFVNVDNSVGNALGNVSSGGELARTNFDKVSGTLVSFWDKVMVGAFFVAVILLFVSAFLIDAHPFFIVLYIFLAFMLVIFMPNILQSIDAIYDSPNFATEVNQLVFLDGLRNNFVPFLVGIIVITGIIIYGKLALGGRGRSANRR